MEPQRLLLHHCHPRRRSDRSDRHRYRRQRRALEGNFLAQRRRIRELSALLAEREAQLPSGEREGDKIKAELEQARNPKKSSRHRDPSAGTRTGALGARTSRRQSGTCERLSRKPLQALGQEQSDLTAAVELLDEETRAPCARCNRCPQEKAAREQTLAQKQAELQRISGSLRERPKRAVTQSRIRNAALGRKTRKHPRQSRQPA